MLPLPPPPHSEKEIKYAFWWSGTVLFFQIQSRFPKRYSFLFLVRTSSNLVVAAAAQIVGDVAVRVRCLWGRRDFLWHAGVERRIFQYIIQAAVSPVIWNRLQPQQVLNGDDQKTEEPFEFHILKNNVVLWFITGNLHIPTYIYIY